MISVYDTIITLRKQKAVAYDTAGNQSITYTDTNVYAQPQGVYHSEFYNAAQAGLHPSVTFRIANRADYDGQKIVKWGEQEYTVIRVDWTAQRDAISLVCEERIHE